MDAYCPQCSQVMCWITSNEYHCTHCVIRYHQLAYCPDCHQPAERLQACGAIGFLCQYGHGVISKKNVQLSYQPSKT